jgi:hypothetical protein
MNASEKLFKEYRDSLADIAEAYEHRFQVAKAALATLEAAEDQIKAKAERAARLSRVVNEHVMYGIDPVQAKLAIDPSDITGGELEDVKTVAREQSGSEACRARGWQPIGESYLFQTISGKGKIQ